MYYIINKTTRALIRQSQTPFNIDENVQPPDPAIQLKRIDDDTMPALNPATQKIVRQFTDDDTAFTRTFHNVVTAMTDAEITAYAEAQQAETTRLQIRAAYIALTNGTGTNVERLQRLERAVAWLLRQVVKNP